MRSVEISDTKRSQLARARGAYLGLAVGDALGATVEFMTAREIAHTYGVHRDMVGGGWLRLKPGQVTDDTAMSLALGGAILHHGQWDLKRVADVFLAWLKSKPVDVGNTCRRGIVRYMHHGSLESPYHEADAGNGACMRNLPVTLYTPDNDIAFEQYSLEQCHLTHNHPLSDAGTLALGRMTRALVLGETRERCRTIADALVTEHRAFRFEPYPKLTTAYIVDTVQTVLHSFFTTESFEDCLVKVVNLGGDADTNGALVGMLAGALYGEASIPYRWLRRLDPRVRENVTLQAEALLKLGYSQSFPINCP
jgi:ADP-ribosyl-[dinitrogen reductase] hydrolase